MRKRIIFLSVGGGLLLAAAFLGTRYLLWITHPQSDAEWHEEKRALANSKRKADLRLDILAGLASARNEKERRLFEYDLRLWDLGEKTTDITSIVNVTNGIDEFEALILARVYFDWQFGACGMVELPERTARGWIATIAAGRDPKPEPPVVIDTKTGVIRCAGHPTIWDPIAFLKRLPNRAPEPML